MVPNSQTKATVSAGGCARLPRGAPSVSRNARLVATLKPRNHSWRMRATRVRCLIRFGPPLPFGVTLNGVWGLRPRRAQRAFGVTGPGQSLGLPFTLLRHSLVFYVAFDHAECEIEAVCVGACSGFPPSPSRARR